MDGTTFIINSRLLSTDTTHVSIQ